MIRIALAQCNPMVGDIAGNVALIRSLRAQADDADLIIFPELCITGYPPEDLVLRSHFRKQAMAAIDALARDTDDGAAAILLGNVWEENGKVYNGCFCLDAGKIIHRQYKINLPNYGVFDEARLFTAGALPLAFAFRGRKIGVLICEDTWTQTATASLAKSGAELLISINSSPYETSKPYKRREVAAARVRETDLPLIYLNCVGGQDEIVFDGGSFVLDDAACETASLPSHETTLGMIIWQENYLDVSKLPVIQPASQEEMIYKTLVLGLHDYVYKTGMQGVLLGLSGGIDSALVAAIAVDALGAQRVRGVYLPSRYSAQDSAEDATETAKLLGIRLDILPIEPLVETYSVLLKEVFTGYPANLAEENIQARIRGNLLMAISNKTGWLLLNTSNKSEMAVGYSTLYGDLCGAYSVIKDIYKTDVYSLSRWRNARNHVIPERSITKAPTAELRANQKDSDFLPEYPELDGILQGLVEQGLSVEEVISQGYLSQTVERVYRLLRTAEYKRRQAPPGTKITTMAFGKDWRYPLAAQ